MKSISAFGNGAVAHVTYIDSQTIDYIIKLVFKIFVTIILKILPKKIVNMSSPLIHEIKGQAFRFLKEKIKTARLALTDVTPVQLMTEEATNENPWPPDTRSTSIIARAAFEVDEYERIIEILHHRFNWGLRVRKLSERILKLLRNKDFFTEERARARNLSHAIKGFGSFNQRSSAIDERLSDLPSKIYGRCNSYYDNRQYEKYDFTSLGKKLSTANGNEREQQIHEDNDNSKLLKQENDPNSGEVTEEYHPFIDDREKRTTASLLSV
ncbi:hypothetical protein JHK82_051911 [Glycine max]|nr:hypothetical protein JHK82_051911 [Glycine max]KAG5096199.1 hypothetical protein JHK84_051787 [Glycine max]